jgi:hypothetical protein
MNLPEPRLKLGILVALMSSMLAVNTPTLAHHSFAPFDATQVRQLTGTIKSFSWSNPHVTFTVLVVASGGSAPQQWNIVTSSPAILKRFAWTPESLKSGDRVSVECNPMSDGSLGGRLHTLVMLGTGRILRTKLSGDLASKPE